MKMDYPVLLCKICLWIYTIQYYYGKYIYEYGLSSTIIKDVLMNMDYLVLLCSKTTVKLHDVRMSRPVQLLFHRVRRSEHPGV